METVQMDQRRYTITSGTFEMVWNHIDQIKKSETGPKFGFIWMRMVVPVNNLPSSVCSWQLPTPPPHQLSRVLVVSNLALSDSSFFSPNAKARHVWFLWGRYDGVSLVGLHSLFITALYAVTTFFMLTHNLWVIREAPTSLAVSKLSLISHFLTLIFL